MHLFFELEASELFNKLRQDLKQVVESASIEQLKAEETFSEELRKRFFIEPLHLSFDSIYVSSREEQIPGEMHPRFDFLVDHMRGQTFARQVITYHIPYTGTSDLLKCMPNPRLLTAPEVSIANNEIMFDIIDFYGDSNRVNNQADQIINTIKQQAHHLEGNVKDYNTALLDNITNFIQKRRAQLQKSSGVIESLGYPVKQPKQTKIVERPKFETPYLNAKYHWDVFISHASEDKDKFVGKLANELSKTIRVWYDEFTLTVGDSLRESIDKGLAKSRYGIVVLSHNFFAKKWPKRELDGLMALEREGHKVILPIWLDIDEEGIKQYSPLLADRVAAKASDGLEKVVEKILKILSKLNK